MKRQQEGKKNQKGFHNSPEKPSGGESPPNVAFALSPWEKVVAFLKRRALVVLGLSFIVITIVVVRIFYRSRLEIVLLVLLILTLGGLVWLESLLRKRKSADTNEPNSDTSSSEVSSGQQGSVNGQQFLGSREAQPNERFVGDLFRQIRKLYDELEAFKKQVDKRFDKLEERDPKNRKPTEEKPLDEAPAYNPSPSRSSASVGNSYQETRSSSVDLQTLERAVSRFLEEERGNCEIDRLLGTIQLWTGSDVSIEVQHLVPQSSGEWRLVALWPQRSQEGLALVSSGGLVDGDVARYFDGSFGGRIIACRQPARISRNGNEVSVLRKGKVESS